MNLNSNPIILTLKPVFKIFFIIFSTAFFLLNAVRLNIYHKTLINPNVDNFELIKVSSSFLQKNAVRTRSTTLNYTFDANDATTLLNLTDFQFIQNHPNKCNTTKNLFMIVFVHSAAANFEKRNSIRSTWGNQKNFQNSVNQIRIIFLVGQSQDLNTSKIIENENKSFGDMVQGNFVDTYRNMTYKHVMGLKWVSYFCRNAQFVFKVDDDVFVDIFQLIYYLKGTFGNSPKNLIACYLNKRAWVSRSYRSKWRVTHKEYSEMYYPRYCAGWGIIMSSDAVLQLYRISTSRPYFWIDDVFVSGLLVKDLKLNHTDIAEHVRLDGYRIDQWLKSDDLTLPPLFGIPDTKAERIFHLWNKTVRYYESIFNYTLTPVMRPNA